MPNTAIIDTEQFVEAIAALLATERKALVEDLRVMLDERDEAARLRESRNSEALSALMMAQSASNDAYRADLRRAG
jgi:hypothetical protein